MEAPRAPSARRAAPRAAAAASAAAAAALLLAGAGGAAAVCDVCQVQYNHKDASTAEPALANTPCAHFAANSCCTAETAIAASSNGGAELYGAEYTWDRCGALSPECERYFVAEACWYECAVEAGKYRRHSECAASDGGNGNSWEIYQAPMSGAYCDAFYEACKADFFCSKTGSGSFFDATLEECSTLTGENGVLSNCKTFEEIYGSGQALCNSLWDESFVYVPETNVSNPEHNASDAFVWDFPTGEPNPNHLVLGNVSLDPSCNDTTHDAWVEFDLMAVAQCSNATAGNKSALP